MFSVAVPMGNRCEMAARDRTRARNGPLRRSAKSVSSTFLTRSFWSLWLPDRTVSDWRWLVPVLAYPAPMRTRAGRVAHRPFLRGPPPPIPARRWVTGPILSTFLGASWPIRTRLGGARTSPRLSGTDAHTSQARRHRQPRSRVTPSTTCGRGHSGVKCLAHSRPQDLRTSGFYFYFFAGLIPETGLQKRVCSRMK